MNTTTGGVTNPTSRKIVGALLGIAVGILVVGLVFMAVQTYLLAHAIRENQKINLQTNRAVASCVTPNGECYKDGQRRTGAAVENIGQLAVFAAACADKEGNQTVPQITACVLSERAKAENRKK